MPNPCLSYDDLIGDEQLCVAIQSVSPEQRHLGIFYRNRNGEKLLHFAWYNDLREETEVENFRVYKYLDVNFLDNEEKSFFIAFLESVFKRNNQVKIPYAPIGGDQLVDGQGHYVGGVREGLTCSLFVLSLFESQKYEFLVKDNWPLRDDDKQWQIKFIHCLYDFLVKRSLNTQDDIELYQTQLRKAESGSPRFRPEEVGAGTTFRDIPNNFPAIEPVSLKIVSSLT